MNILSLPRTKVGMFVDISTEHTITMRVVFRLQVTRQMGPYAGTRSFRAENEQDVRFMLAALRTFASASGEVLRIHNDTPLPEELMGIAPEEQRDLACE